MKRIKLTQNQISFVDDEDFEYLNQFTWQACKKKDGNSWYALRSYKENGKYKKIGMHREIMNLLDKIKVVDHINHNGLDNRKENLRICTIHENNRNKTVSKTKKSSIYLGVSIHRKKWRATIWTSGKTISAGYFSCQENAAIAYNILAEKYHGQFANYNK